MAEPAQSIFNFNAYSPAEIGEAVETIGVTKTNLPFLASFALSMIAGGGIGLGALYYNIVASDAGLGFAATRVVGGLVFSLGLALVLVGGAELFTGNNLIVMAWASGKVSTREMLRNWVIVYIGNFVGSMGTCWSRFSLASSGYERRARWPVDADDGSCKNQPRYDDAVLQRHSVQLARLLGSLACLRGAVRHG